MRTNYSRTALWMLAPAFAALSGVGMSVGRSEEPKPAMPKLGSAMEPKSEITTKDAKDDNPANHATDWPHHLAARVIIISEDGLRPDLLSTMHAPWHEALYRHGSYSWKARTIRTASTLPAHASMLSGVDVNIHGLTWNNWRPSRGYIKALTIFGTAEQAGMKTMMFVGKNKLKHIATPGTVDLYERPGYYCKKVAEEAAMMIVRERPPLSFIHFSDPDEAGHANGWSSDRYRASITHSDTCLGVIVTALEKAKMLDETLIIISADHGGHNHAHSGAFLIDREIPWIAHGPGVREDYRIHQAISTLDTAPTALYALGLPVSPQIQGKAVMEIYRPSSAPLSPLTTE